MAVAVPAAAAAILAVDIAETVLIQIVGQLVSAVVGSVLAPELLAVQQLSFKVGIPGDITQGQTRALDAASSVEAFIKGHRSAADSRDDLAAVGYSTKTWEALTASAGEPPGLDFLTEAFRRGFIARAGTGAESTSLEQGIKESRLKDKWIPTVEQMQFLLAPAGVVLEGWLRAQITETQARDLLRKAGIDEPTATLMYKSAGRPPGPQELIELTRRGIIPEAGEGGDTLSLRQGYLETDLKNKWYDTWKRLMEYVPPPRTVTALLRAGSITEAHALQLFQHAGLTAELAAVYVANAHHETAQATRDLTKAEIMALYAERQLTAAQVTEHLAKLHYPAEVAALEIELADYQAERSLVSHAVSRLRSFYTGHKLDEQAVMDGLKSLGYVPAAIEQALRAWRIERDDNVKVLTPAQILDLASDEIEDEATVMGLLVAEGYSALDAWYLLAIKLRGRQTSPRPGA